MKEPLSGRLKKRGFLTMTLGLTLAFTAFLMLTSQGLVTGQETRIIRIHGGGAMYGGQSIVIEPETLRVPKGTVVVWSNGVRSPNIKIIFENGKGCAEVTEAPMGFKLDDKLCFVTSWLPYGGTSSLLFNHAGVFDYEVKNTAGTPGEKKIKGRLIVE